MDHLDSGMIMVVDGIWTDERLGREARYDARARGWLRCSDTRLVTTLGHEAGYEVRTRGWLRCSDTRLVTMLGHEAGYEVRTRGWLRGTDTRLVTKLGLRAPDNRLRSMRHCCGGYAKSKKPFKLYGKMKEKLENII